MLHVFGMAKSFVGVKPGQAKSLEENFLKLEKAIETVQSGGETAHGYILVLGESPERRLRGWTARRGLDHHLTILRPQLTPREDRLLQEEKQRMRSRSKPSDSSASFGGPLAEKLLEAEIRRRHRGIQKKKGLQLGVSRDFYGVVGG